MNYNFLFFKLSNQSKTLFQIIFYLIFFFKINQTYNIQTKEFSRAKQQYFKVLRSFSTQCLSAAGIPEIRVPCVAAVL